MKEQERLLPSPESEIEAAKGVLREFLGRLLDIPWFSPTKEPDEDELQQLVNQLPEFKRSSRKLPLKIIKNDWVEIARLLEVWRKDDLFQPPLAQEGTIMRRAQKALFESINGTPADNRETAFKLMCSVDFAILSAVFDAVPFRGKGQQKFNFCFVLICGTQLPNYTIPDTLASVAADKLNSEGASDDTQLKIFAKGCLPIGVVRTGGKFWRPQYEFAIFVPPLR